MWTDPPYGVTYTGKTADALTIENDSRDLDDLYRLLDDAFSAAVQHTRPGAAWYVAGPNGPNSLIFGTVLTNLGIWRQTLVWIKDRFVLGHSDYHYRHELIYEGDTPTEPDPAPETQEPTSLFYGWRPGHKHRAPTERTHDSVWEVPRPSASKDHPTMKPVALIAKALEISTLRGQLVLDPFGGSGSTLAAAAVTGRRSALIELDPRYVDVICERYYDLTGDLPVLEATGRPFVPRDQRP